MNTEPVGFVEPRPAATVVVIRQGGEGPEVLMVKRHARAAFASSYVFPGGVLEPDDDLAQDRCEELGAAVANSNLGIERNALSYYSAAFREVLEETGVWLPPPEVSIASIDRQVVRDGLNDGSLGWLEFLERHDLRLPCNLLHYIAYWVTPRTEPKRFSTRFFLAKMPRDQAAKHDGCELTDSCWMKPQDVLQAGSAGNMLLPYPTRSTLRDIAEFEDVAQIVEWAKSRAETGIAKQLPAFVTVKGKGMVVMPGSPYYPDDYDR